MGRATRLLDRTPEEIEVLLGHPVQHETARLIAQLVAELRSLRSPGDYYEFQRELFSHVYHAQQRQAEASRNAKRIRSGRPVPEPDAPTWDLALVLWDRSVRQLRAVGDALAWRRFGYDRRFILALSRNQTPAPIVDKGGLDHELGAVVEAWERDGNFALLHDLTNSVRIGDLTVFESSQPTIVEVKASEPSGSRHREQVRRAQRAVAVINEGATLPGAAEDVELLVSDQQFKTRLDRLRSQLERARVDGISSQSIGHQQAITAIAVTARIDQSTDDLYRRSDALKSRAFAKAGLDTVDHHLRGVRADRIGWDPHLAPFTVFPFAPEVVAALTTDLVCFEYVVGWDRLADAFEARGFDVELLLEEASGPIAADVAVLHDHRSDLRITIHSGGLDQLLHELVDVDRFVDAVAQVARRLHTIGVTRSVFTFMSERATWR